MSDDKCCYCGGTKGQVSPREFYCTACQTGTDVDRTDDIEAENAKLKAIVDKLPKTADGVPAYKDMPVWAVMQDGSIYDSLLGWYCPYGAGYAHRLVMVSAGYRMANGCWLDVHVDVERCYSTREAAEAAKENEDD